MRLFLFNSSYNFQWCLGHFCRCAHTNKHPWLKQVAPDPQLVCDLKELGFVLILPLFHMAPTLIVFSFFTSDFPFLFFFNLLALLLMAFLHLPMQPVWQHWVDSRHLSEIRTSAMMLIPDVPVCHYPALSWVSGRMGPDNTSIKGSCWYHYKNHN